MKLFLVMQAFDRKLAEITTLVQTMEQDSYHFEEYAVKLLSEIETMAQQYALPFQPNLSLLQANLLCGNKEDSSPAANRKEKTKEKKRYVINQLSEAVRIVQQYFEDTRKQFDDCEKICGQIIISAQYKGLTGCTSDLYTAVEQDGELGAHLANVKAAVGTVNAMVIFEQAKAYMSSDPSISQ